MFTVGTWSLGCFHSHISTQTFFEGTDLVDGQLHGDKESLEEGAGRRRSWCLSG